MSATGRSDVRDPLDHYATPAHVTRAILPYLAPVSGSTLDPCAGDGAILKAIGTGIGLEINPNRAGITRDALSSDPWPLTSQVIMNPPFRLAMEFVTRALREVRPGGEVAALLRLNWLASAGRKAFHRAHPADVYVLPSRPEFAASLKCKKKCGWEEMLPIEAARPSACPGCGASVSITTTDATEYAWFIWSPSRGNRWFLLDDAELHHHANESLPAAPELELPPSPPPAPPPATAEARRAEFVTRAIAEGLIPQTLVAREGIDGAWHKLQYLAPKGWFLGEPLPLAPAAGSGDEVPLIDIVRVLNKKRLTRGTVTLQQVGEMTPNERRAVCAWVNTGAVLATIPSALAALERGQFVKMGPDGSTDSVSGNLAPAGCSGCTAGTAYGPGTEYLHTGNGPKCKDVTIKSQIVVTPPEHAGDFGDKPKRGRPRKLCAHGNPPAMTCYGCDEDKRAWDDVKAAVERADAP